MKENSEIIIIQNFGQSIEVMHEVGMWMEKAGLHPSQWWKPQNMNKAFLFQHTEPEEHYVALANGIPAASMVLQETERNQSWKSVDGEKPKRALYVHWLCVARKFAGKGLPNVMIKFATNEAQKRGFKLLRLDTDADEEKLCSLYIKLGFKMMGTEKEGDHKTAFFQKVV